MSITQKRPRKPHIVAGRTFNTQADMRKYTQEILYRNAGQTLSGDDLSFVLGLLDRHPARDKKIGSGIDCICAEATGTYSMILRKNTLCFVIHRTDGTNEDFSFNKCISGKDDLNRKRMQAYRSAVDDQIIRFKRQHEKEYCQICGRRERDLQVDHVISFVDLVMQFENSCPDTIPQVLTEDPVTRQIKFCQEDQDFENKWTAFHQTRAVLRMLCPKCNLSRTDETRLWYAEKQL